MSTITEKTHLEVKNRKLFYINTYQANLRKAHFQKLGIKIIVNKKRKIYGIENVILHFDIVENLGAFIEVEAIDENENYTIEELKKQCDYYYDYFKIHPEQIEKLSYSDLLLRIKKDQIRSYFANVFPGITNSI